MKNLRILALIVVIVVLLGIFAAVKGVLNTGSSEDQIRTPISGEMLSGSGEYALLPSESEVNWAGHKRLIPGYTDRGIIPLTSGEITVEEGDITEGEIVFDIANISATSTSIGEPSGLTRHLRSDDFFGVEGFPEARLDITGTERGTDEDSLTILGDLTIKNETHDIEIPVDVRVQEDGRLLTQGAFTIDRTRWGITYGSGSFFQDLGDQVIANEVDISFEAVFAPADTLPETNN